MKKISKNATLLLLCLFINSITSIFIYTYLLAFILDVSNNGIVNVALFYLVLHLSMIILSWIFAPFFKKYNKSISLKLGISLKLFFVLLVVLIKDSIIDYVYIIAICDAISEVAFWGGVNALRPLVTKNSSLSTYMSITKILNTFTNLVIPILMGFAIDKTGINFIAIAMTVLVAFQFTIAIFINENSEVDVNKLNYKLFSTDVKKIYPEYKKIYTNLFLYGFCTNISMLILYFTVITFNSNISLGIFSTITSILSMIILSLYNIKKSWFNNYLTAILSSIFVVLSVIFIIVELNRFSLIIFYLFWNISISIPEIISDSRRLNIVKNNDLKIYNIENLTISETYLDIGRVLGEIILLSMGLFNNRIYDIICLCTITLFVIVYFIQSITIRNNKNNLSLTEL